MRRVILAVSALAVVALAKPVAFNQVDDDYYPTEPQWHAPSFFRSGRRGVESVNITVDVGALEEMGNSIGKKWKDFERKFKNHTRKEAKEYEKAIVDAYKNTVGKIIMDFGDTVAPIIENAGELLEEVRVNKSCDMDCAVKCFKPKKADRITEKYVLGFNRECFGNCSCAFRFESWTPKQQEKAQKNAEQFDESIEDFIEFGRELAQEA